MQVPVPPVPPVPPEVMVATPGVPIEVVLITLVVVAGLAFMFTPLLRAVARRIERGGGDPNLRAELDDLRERMREMEQSHGRMAELEERIDFAERLLTKGQDVKERAS